MRTRRMARRMLLRRQPWLGVVPRPRPREPRARRHPVQQRRARRKLPRRKSPRSGIYSVNSLYTNWAWLHFCPLSLIVLSFCEECPLLICCLLPIPVFLPAAQDAADGIPALHRCLRPHALPHSPCGRPRGGPGAGGGVHEGGGQRGRRDGAEALGHGRGAVQG